MSSHTSRIQNIFKMAQYWYLGARVKESSAASNGRIRQHDVARWVNQVFDSAESAAAAAPLRMAKHPGVAYFVQGFEHKLIIDAEGYSLGFEKLPKGVQ